MKVLKVRNVHEALPRAIDELLCYGIPRGSRYGDVLLYPQPVTTVYENPCERVLFWPERDANPFFHLYEMLWMVAGRNDVAGPAQFAKRMETFSDDGKTFHGAYGKRWRKWFADWSQPPNSETGLNPNLDQLELIALELKENPDSRRCVLQMWDGQFDLGRNGKDLPCNTIATFQIDSVGNLHLTVFCRSNDIIWGAYGANAVHFSFLLEYMATWIGCPVGTYTQVSVNWHGYTNTLEKVKCLQKFANSVKTVEQNPYAQTVAYYPLPRIDIASIDLYIQELLALVDTPGEFSKSLSNTYPSFFEICYNVLAAHRKYKLAGVNSALEQLALCSFQDADWVVAAREWLERRAKNNE